jgi:Ca2+-binding RTX toxin-like protein
MSLSENLTPASVLVSTAALPPFVDRTIIGTDRSETLRGGQGLDSIVSGGGDDVLWGFGSRDYLTAGPDGNCTLYGGGDDDVFYAGRGVDVLYGGVDDDYFISLPNATRHDTIYGGAGDDYISYELWTVGVVVDMRRVPSGAWASVDVLFSIEDLFGSDANDTVVGNSVRNYLNGRGGDDRLSGLSGDDLLIGAEGDDTLIGGDNQDALFGDDGDDVLIGGKGSDTLLGDGGSDQFVFRVQSDIGGGNDRIRRFEVGVDKIVIGALEVGSDTPEISFFVRLSGVTIVTVGDVRDPLFTIAVTGSTGPLTLNDIDFAFLG